MNYQETYDKVLFALRKQKIQSFYGDTCRYRDGYGNKCAFGHLIPDELYDSCIEGYTLTSLVAKMRNDQQDYLYDLITNKLGYENCDFPFLIDLQKAHDRDLGVSYEAWEVKMRAIAAKYCLMYTEPQ